ncbi:hypothetical protein [Nocardia sp. NPDC051832]|uniref:hypothetical protein n=1 Tax=Nocardia sp. NPDC051832 TaxID=3155673 RepID=UPI003411FDEC
MSDARSRYIRQDWFGPESFGAAMVGMVAIALPYTGLVPRSAGWLIPAPFIVGVLLVAVSASGLGLSTVLRRAGVGFVGAFAGFLLAILGLLGGISLGSLVA